MELLKIYGDIFTTGARALVFLALGEVINAATGSTGAILLMTGKQKWEVLNSFCILILNVAFNLYLIPKYGIEGAAIGFTLSISIINVLKLLETYKEFKIHPYSMKYFKGFFAITVGAVLAFWYYQLLKLLGINYLFNLSTGIAVLLLSSFIALYFFKFDEEDKMILRKIVQKIKPNSNH
jgi:O-antigen/teichoic acid export membrane protein